MAEYPPIYAYLDGIARGRRETLDQAAEQIKALNMRATTSGWLSVNDVLAVLAEMRGNDG